MARGGPRSTLQAACLTAVLAGVIALALLTGISAQDVPPQETPEPQDAPAEALAQPDKFILTDSTLEIENADGHGEVFLQEVPCQDVDASWFTGQVDAKITWNKWARGEARRLCNNFSFHSMPSCQGRPYATILRTRDLENRYTSTCVSLSTFHRAHVRSFSLCSPLLPSAPLCSSAHMCSPLLPYAPLLPCAPLCSPVLPCPRHALVAAALRTLPATDLPASVSCEEAPSGPAKFIQTDSTLEFKNADGQGDVFLQEIPCQDVERSWFTGQVNAKIT
ncbi:unnamed protein product [Closterium sp. Naga37s-1]|nr:unnamed protein product [Closterium sp. Naga37s-1]